MKKYILLFLLTFQFLGYSTLRGNIIFVNQQATCEDADGDSWTTAFCDLQEALAIAATGDSIWIAQGVYYPTNGSNRDTSFHLVAGIPIFGGFSGTETQLTQRDWVLNETILSGEIGDTSILYDNTYHVLQAYNLDNLAIIDGLIIERGIAQDNIGIPENLIGGGLKYSVNTPGQTAWLIIRNTTFRNNRARGDNTDFRYGGGAISNEVAEGSLNIVIDNCLFDANEGKIPVMNTRIEGTEGTVNMQLLNSSFINHPIVSSIPFIIYNGVDSSKFEVLINNCQFDNNEGSVLCESWGGDTDLTVKNSDFSKFESNGIEVIHEGGNIVFDIDSCQFVESQGINININQEPFGGVSGGVIPEKLVAEISDLNFTENTEKAISIRATTDSASLKMYNCNFSNSTFLSRTFVSFQNRLPSNQFTIADTNADIKNCNFLNNIGLTNLYIGATNSETNFLIEDCQFNNNQFYHPMYINYGYCIANANGDNTKDSLIIKNCSFINNSNINPGGIIAAHDADDNGSNNTTIENCVFQNNILSNPSQIVGIFYNTEVIIYGNSLFQTVNSFYSNLNIQNCRFENNHFLRDGGINKTISSSLFNISLNNCEFIKNKGNRASIFYLESTSDTSSQLINNNCVFYGNEAVPMINGGAGLFYNAGAKIVSQNAIFSNNTNGGTINSPLINNTPQNATSSNLFQNCLLQADTTNLQYTTFDNILYDIDPLFQDEAAGDLRLQLCSPAISAGNNDFVDSIGLLTDIAGLARIQGGTVDLGAHESPGLDIQTTTSPTACLNGAAEGTIDLTIENGCEPYSIAWENEVSDNLQLDSLSAGDYTLVITDGAGKTDTVEVQIQALPEDFTDMVLQPYDCSDGATGEITLSPNAPAQPPFQYAWNTGTTDSSLTNLLPGIYFATVTDANNCVDTLSAVVESNNNLSLDISAMPISCHDSQDGTAAVTPLSGIAPFQYEWNEGTADSILTNLGGGNYSVMVTDSVQCSDELSFMIMPPDSISVDFFAQNNSCADSNDGAIGLMPSGGTGDFDFIWNTLQTNDTIANLMPGIYTATITDDAECSTTFLYEVTAPLPLLLDSMIVDVSCYDGDDGSIIVQPNGGTMPYFYEWENGVMDSVLTNLSVGNYAIAILDANGCALATNFQIQQADSISIISQTVDASSPNSADGEIAILNTIGGTAPFAYAWNTGQTTPTISNLLAGIYEVTTTDDNGCEQIFTFEVDFISNTNASSNATDLATISPNPVKTENWITIEMKGIANPVANISLFDAAGKLVLNTTTHFLGNQLSIKAPSVSGMYLLKIAVENKSVQVGKVLVF